MNERTPLQQVGEDYESWTGINAETIEDIQEEVESWDKFLERIRGQEL